MHGPKHRLCVRLLTKLVAKVGSELRHAQIQLPVVCGDDQMPEPDFAIIRGADREYTDKLPTASDTLCVVEVADSSLERDEEEKLPIYATAGVPQYIILNLRDRTAEVYTVPNTAIGTYPPPTVITEGGIVSFSVAADEVLAVPLVDLLPSSKPDLQVRVLP